MTVQAILPGGALGTGFSPVKLGQIFLASFLVVVMLAVPPAQLYASPSALSCIEKTITFALSCGISVATSAGNPVWVVIVSGALCGWGYTTTIKCWVEYSSGK